MVEDVDQFSTNSIVGVPAKSHGSGLLGAFVVCAL